MTAADNSAAVTRATAAAAQANEHAMRALIAAATAELDPAHPSAAAAIETGRHSAAATAAAIAATAAACNYETLDQDMQAAAADMEIPMVPGPIRDYITNELAAAHSAECEQAANRAIAAADRAAAAAEIATAAE